MTESTQRPRSTMGWQVSIAITCFAGLAGMELVIMKTLTLATLMAPVVTAMVYGYQEKKRNGRSHG